MDLRSLETFVWVVNLGSFRGAAAKLRTTQPAVSQRIAALEAEFGVRLVDRSQRRAVATERGRTLLAYAERMLRLCGEMRLAVSEHDVVRGTLRLGVSETIVHTWLPRLIEQVSNAHPGLSLEVDVDITPNLRERLVAQEIDLAFLLGPVSASSVRNCPLCAFPLAFLASPRLDLPAEPVPLEALAAHPLITFSRRTRPYIAVSELFARADLPPLRLHASAALGPVIRMAVDGFGIAVAPPAIAAAEIAGGRLRVVRATVDLADLAFTASWPVTPDGFAAEAVASIAIAVARRDEADRAALHPGPA